MVRQHHKLSKTHPVTYVFDKIWAIKSVSVLCFNTFLLAVLQNVSCGELFDAAPVKFVPLGVIPKLVHSGDVSCELRCLCKTALVIYDAHIGHVVVPFLIPKVHVGPLTFRVVPVTEITSLSGILSTFNSISATSVGKGEKNLRNLGRYGSKSLEWRFGFFAPKESSSTVGACPLLTPSRRRTPAVRIPSYMAN